MKRKPEYRPCRSARHRRQALVGVLWRCLVPLVFADFGLACAAGFTDADWVSLGSGVRGNNPSVRALAIIGTNLYAGGVFSVAGTGTARCLAKWDGRAWSALASELIDPNGYDYIATLAVMGTNLYVGGRFTNFGGVTVKNVAKWDGKAWSALGSGMNLPARVLAVNGTNLYAGGEGQLLKWQGNGWADFAGLGGSGVIPAVAALAPAGTNLYAGGWFASAGGIAARNIARWDGHTWWALGLGTDHNVLALAVSGTNVYAGGDFTTAGGVPANGIARWNGSAWSALGSGVNGWIYGLAVRGTDLYAAGTFTVAGGVPANHIAKWDGSTWSALGSGVGPSFAGVLLADGAGHLFVGGQFTTAGGSAAACIAQANLGLAPLLITQPQSQTAELKSTVHFKVDASGSLPLGYQWYFESTNLMSSTTNRQLTLTDVQFGHSGSYTVVVTNRYDAVTSAPAVLNVIAPVERRPVPALGLTAPPGRSVHLEQTSALDSTGNWLALDTVVLTASPELYFDVTAPLSPRRFYRAWQSESGGQPPALTFQHLVPGIALTGAIGSSVRLDYINQFGPIDAWVPLATVTLTNTSQLYLDTSAIAQPPRLWRIVPVP